jgi:hypothetical protein
MYARPSFVVVLVFYESFYLYRTSRLDRPRAGGYRAVNRNGGQK